MYEKFGAVVNGNDIEFKLFFPDNSKDPSQYTRGSLPNIDKIQVTGTFQEKLGGSNWDFQNAPDMAMTPHPKGFLFQMNIEGGLPEGYYEYKYFVTFKNGTTRWCTDPCTKYGGGEMENSAFVVGGNDTDVQPIRNRLPQKDLIIYELMPDDFTAEFRGNMAPFKAIREKLDYLQNLGVNAIEFMPWTAWIGSDFYWGYRTFQFFSVEHRYINDPLSPLDKLYWLKVLINELHNRGMHVIMDGVFNHTWEGSDPGRGFAYYWLYEDPGNSPFTGDYSGGGYFQDLDFKNACTHEFILDVCKYWLDEYKIDGIRFDYTLGYFDKNHLDTGITRLCEELSAYLLETRYDNISLMLEHLTDNRYDAIDDTNHSAATGCWYDRLMFESRDYIQWGNVDARIMRALNTAKDFSSGKGPVTYIENHDHSSFINKARGRSWWWKTQPYVIALMTCPGTVLIHNGQEFGQDYDMPEDGPGRVVPRPLDWDYTSDQVGNQLQNLYRKMIKLRKDHPSLRSTNFYPESYDLYFNNEGYGVNVNKDVVVYHRWGKADDGSLERFIIVLNFSSYNQYVDIPFSTQGLWRDLLNDHSIQLSDYRLFNQKINSNWGKIYYNKEA
ncbi:MAG: 1,4-alpha-glucan branching enzyme [candidate division Zixibacteria bacterium]|nr:1,4-alpha-glucan branching enzyme [candidate division Zixibacteria bacterium]